MNGLNEFAPNQYLARRLNITDSPAPANTLAPEIMPVISALAESQENLYLRGERQCALGYSHSGAALNYSVAVLENPTASGMLIMLDRVNVQYASAAVYFFQYLERLFIPALGAINGSVCDSRWPLAVGGARRHAAVVGFGNTATAPNFNWAAISTLNGAGVWEPKLTIAPGSAWILYTNDFNINMVVNLDWRERPAQPSELV